jgi:hypothetical protein
VGFAHVATPAHEATEGAAIMMVVKRFLPGAVGRAARKALSFIGVLYAGFGFGRPGVLAFEFDGVAVRSKEDELKRVSDGHRSLSCPLCRPENL